MMLCGADEAGRGPVLGPLVVAAVAVEDDTVLKGIGVRDSKKLTPARREHLFDIITSACEVTVLSLSATEIDSARGRMSLNAVEAEAFAQVLRPFRNHSMFVDCADVSEEGFASTIRSLLGDCGPLVCRHRADDTYAVVSAASIIAKVTRDRAMADLEKECGEVLGSGYPSDPKTIRFLETWIKDKGNPPPFARRSWETTRRMLSMARTASLDDW